ncbi:uncharacterized protein LOC135490876 isoform X2 [Lineus longissimus]|uniref:uncharacterized protein LOC135490876 isoform X2 n=1 Tax=Lineus longissimus TaxID=88925 RepID=UPI00315CA994
MSNNKTFFFQQSSHRKTPKRYRKTPEELPQSLRFAHLNPKVAAYLASKENKLKHPDDSDFTDGSFLGFDSIDESAQGSVRKSMLPEISEAVSNVKTHLNSSFGIIADERTQRLLFEESKLTLPNILLQLERLLRQIEFECIRVHIPKSIEHRLLQGYKELTSEAILIYREWQTIEAKVAYEKEMARRSEEEKLTDKDSSLSAIDGDSGKHEKDDHHQKRRKSGNIQNKVPNPKISLHDISEDEEAGENVGLSTDAGSSQRRVERSGSVMSIHHHSRDSGLNVKKTRLEKLRGLHGGGLSSSRSSFSDRKSSVRKSFALGDESSSLLGESISESQKSIIHSGYYVPAIQFALSSKVCEEKGWIVHDDRNDIEKETILEWARQKLQLTLRESHAQYAKSLALGHDKPIQIRYYGDQKKEAMLKYNRRGPANVRPQTALVKGLYPRVPSLLEHDKLKSKETQDLFLAAIPDGTMIVHYPSGRVAIQISSAGMERPGFYTNVFDDSSDRRVLASFTPTGKGCCYHTNGYVRFLSSDKGGRMSEQSGALSKTWKWPANNAKLPVTIIIHLNDNITFRCSNLYQMQLLFTCQKETAKINVSAVSGAVEPNNREEMGHLQTGLPFTSQAAKEYAKPYRPKPMVKTEKKKKNKDLKDKSKAQLTELKSLLELPESERHDSETDRDLAKIQRKIRNVVEDWMDHYRMSLGISSPHIRNMRDVPDVRKRGVQSAKSSPGEVISAREAGSPLPDTTDMQMRSPSAPLMRVSARSPRPHTAASTHPSSASGVKFDEECVEIASLARSTPFPPSLIGDKSKSLSYTMTKPKKPLPTIPERSAGSRSSRSRQRPVTAGPEYLPLPPKGICPVSLQRELLGEEPSLCKCNRYKIPYITDVEYDELIRESPEKQLIIVSVVSSLFPDATSAALTLEQMYSERHKNRTRPCNESKLDPYRIFKYDVATAAEYTNYTQPLLLRRHNVVAGMFLMYQNRRLLFCDHIFNGYGNAKKDFNKQLMKTRKDALMGFSLPHDFRFSPSRGRHGMRSAWGGEIGGAGVDRHGSPGITLESSVIFHRTESISSNSSDGRDLPYADFPIRSVTAHPTYRQAIPVPILTSSRKQYRAATAPAYRMVVFSDFRAGHTAAVK